MEIFQAKWNQKESGYRFVVYDKINLKEKLSRRDKEHYISHALKGIIHPDDVVIISQIQTYQTSLMTYYQIENHRLISIQ